MPPKFDKGSSSGGIIKKALDTFNLRKSRDSNGDAFNGFSSLGKKQTAQNGSGLNMFGIRIGQEPRDE